MSYYEKYIKYKKKYVALKIKMQGGNIFNNLSSYFNKKVIDPDPDPDQSNKKVIKINLEEYQTINTYYNNSYGRSHYYFIVYKNDNVNIFEKSNIDPHPLGFNYKIINVRTNPRQIQIYSKEYKSNIETYECDIETKIGNIYNYKNNGINGINGIHMTVAYFQDINLNIKFMREWISKKENNNYKELNIVLNEMCENLLSNAIKGININNYKKEETILNDFFTKIYEHTKYID